MIFIGNFYVHVQFSNIWLRMTWSKKFQIVIFQKFWKYKKKWNWKRGMGIGIECSQARDPRSCNYKSYLDDLFIFTPKFLSFERSRSPQDDIFDWQDKGKSAILINCEILFRKKNKKGLISQFVPRLWIYEWKKHFDLDFKVSFSNLTSYFEWESRKLKSCCWDEVLKRRHRCSKNIFENKWLEQT